jgi:hypothetical protein
MDNQLIKRIERIETRLVQLMLWLGADPSSPNTEGGFFDEMKETVFGETTVCISSTNAEPGTDWSKFDRPAYQRRRRDSD